MRSTLYATAICMGTVIMAPQCVLLGRGGSERLNSSPCDGRSGAEAVLKERAWTFRHPRPGMHEVAGVAMLRALMAYAAWLGECWIGSGGSNELTSTYY